MAHRVETIHDLSEGHTQIVITQNGEAKTVPEDVANYAETQVLLKLLATARDDITAGRVQPLEGLKERIRGHAAR
jgi:hypothetical protein